MRHHMTDNELRLLAQQVYASTGGRPFVVLVMLPDGSVRSASNASVDVQADMCAGTAASFRSQLQRVVFVDECPLSADEKGEGPTRA